MADDKASLIIKVQEESGKPGAPPPPPGLGAEAKAPEPGRDPFNLEGLKDFFNKLPDNLIKMLKGDIPGGGPAPKPDLPVVPATVVEGAEPPKPSKTAPYTTEKEWEEQNKWLHRVPASGDLAEHWEDVREPPGKIAKAYGITPEPTIDPSSPTAPPPPPAPDSTSPGAPAPPGAPPPPPTSPPTKNVPKPVPPGPSPIALLDDLARVIPTSISGLVAMGAAALGVGAIVGLAVAGFKALVNTLKALDSAIENATESYAAFSPEIAISLAERQIKIMEERFRQAVDLTPLMSQYQSAKGDLDVTMLQIKAALLKQLIPLMQKMIEAIQPVADNIVLVLNLFEDTNWLENLLVLALKAGLPGELRLALTAIMDILKMLHILNEKEDEEGGLTDAEKWMQDFGDFLDPESAAATATTHMVGWNSQSSPSVSGVF